MKTLKSNVVILELARTFTDTVFCLSGSQEISHKFNFCRSTKTFTKAGENIYKGVKSAVKL